MNNPKRGLRDDGPCDSRIRHSLYTPFLSLKNQLVNPGNLKSKPLKIKSTWNESLPHPRNKYEKLFKKMKRGDISVEKLCVQHVTTRQLSINLIGWRRHVPKSTPLSIPAMLSLGRYRFCRKRGLVQRDNCSVVLQQHTLVFPQYPYTWNTARGGKADKCMRCSYHQIVLVKFNAHFIPSQKWFIWYSLSTIYL